MMDDKGKSEAERKKTSSDGDGDEYGDARPERDKEGERKRKLP